MRAERAADRVMGADSVSGGDTSVVRLPPLWLLGALAAVVMILAAPKDALDVFEYHCYALDFWQGAQGAHAAHTIIATKTVSCKDVVPGLAASPFHELPREYGPLALVFFSLPLLAPLGWYNTIFNALMCAVILGIAWLLNSYGPRGSGHIWLLYTLLGVMLVAAGRFDALPAAAALIALIAAQRGRVLTSYAALAAGVLLKFYPLALLPLLVISSWRRRREQSLWRGPALFAGLLIAGEGIAALLSPQGVTSPLGFLSARCVEAEAYPATLSFLWASLTGGSVHYFYAQQFGSKCQIGPGIDGATIITAMAALAGLAAVYWLYWRGRLSLAQGFLFVTGLLIVGAKVFSVQYLIWLSPFVAYVYGLEIAALIAWGAVCLATSLYYPVSFTPWVILTLGTWLVDHIPLLIAVRNILMVVVGVLAFRGALRRSSGDGGNEPAQEALSMVEGGRPR